MKKIILLIFILLSLSACQSTFAPSIGMARNQWLRQTIIADQVYLQNNWEVYKSGGKFYYFKDGKLDHVDQGQMMQQRFQVEIINK